MQNGQFGSKMIFAKKMTKMNLQEQLSCSVQKTAGNAKWAVGSKIFLFKKRPKMNLQEQLSCSVQKTAGKKQPIFDK